MFKVIVPGVGALVAFFLSWFIAKSEVFNLQDFVVSLVIGLLLVAIFVASVLERYRVWTQPGLNPNLVYELVSTGYNYNVPVFTLKYFNIDKGWQEVEFRGRELPKGFHHRHYPNGRVCIIHENKGPLSNPI